MLKDKFINVRVPADLAHELDNLHSDYKAAELANISFAAFLEMLVRRGAKQIRERIDATAYAVTDPH
jgi:hypothetical protein